MGLRNTAYLVTQESPLQSPSPKTAVFELRNIEESSSTQEPNYIMGGRGQFIRQSYRYLTDLDTFNVSDTSAERRAGFWIDGGAGEWAESLTFKVSGESDVPLRWGDGESPENELTRTDASGTDMDALARRQIFDYWLAQTRSDSMAHTRLHIGEWTDGSFDDYRDGQKVNVDAGVFGYPIPVGIISTNLQSPEDETDAFTGRLELARVARFAGPDEELPSWSDVLIDSAGPLLPVPDA